MGEAPLRVLLLREYGAVVGGRELRRVLGFRNAAAFGRAVRSGKVPLNFLRLPGRRGRFALVSEIADWLENPTLRLPNSGGQGVPHLAREGPKM